MENASKALLIAGAILLVIAIIGIGMAIFGQAQGVIDQGGKQIDTLAVQAHNSIFDSYIDRTVKGRTIKDLGARIASYNQTADNAYIVTIKFKSGADAALVDLVNKDGLTKVTTAEDSATNLSTLISANKNYAVTGDMNAVSGIINTVVVTAQ